MAQLAKGIVGGEMPWGLILIGVAFAVALILIKAPAPMLIAVGMYLPFETTFAIFVGGLIKGAADGVSRRKLEPRQRGIFENVGVLLASGFIAGEALTGVVIAGLVLLGVSSISDLLFGVEMFPFVEGPVGGFLSLGVFALMVYFLIRVPLGSAKKQ
jgi:uncharacterized oligopeptide transporter (OPT) family protein